MSRVARARLARRALRWAGRLRLPLPEIRIQPMTRKWASCSTRGRITLALDLCGKPGAMQDLVIVHELLHLRYPDHGKLFKAVLTAHLPGWRDAETRYLKPSRAA